MPSWRNNAATGKVVRGHRETIGERLRRDCEHGFAPAPFDACEGNAGQLPVAGALPDE